MGACYYKGFRVLYVTVEDPSKQLVVKKSAQEVNEGLVKAMLASTASNPNRGPLVEWLNTTTSVNQKEYVGLLRLALDIRPSVSTSSCTLLVEFSKFVVRLNLDVDFAEETAIVRHHFDSALTQALAACAGNECPSALSMTCTRSRAA